MTTFKRRTTAQGEPEDWPPVATTITSAGTKGAYRGAMGTATRINPQAFPDSPYAAELTRGCANQRFSPQVESEYSRARLMESRTLIRVSCVLAALVAIARGLEQAALGSWNGFLVIDFGSVICGSIVLASVAWSPLFQRMYLPWARIVIPLRNTVVAAHIAEAAARGNLEVLMGLPLLLIGPFFFFGLPFRTSLFAGLLTVGSFVTSAIFFELAFPVALRSCTFLLLAAISCAVAARHFENRSRAGFLQDRLIADLAQHDALTGTKNRRVFDEYLARLWQQAIDDGRAMAILLIDVDHFKAYNDCYGHQAGDQALRRVAQTVQRFVQRPLDILARYGGEEFAAILYDLDVDQARTTADRICRAVGELGIEHRESRTAPKVTISVGVAAIEPAIERNHRGALQLADQALYEAKVRGRNRVVLLDEAEYRTLVTGVFVNPSRAGRTLT
jgi:diguanylate cyclase (GGDEF)-like protein